MVYLSTLQKQCKFEKNVENIQAYLFYPKVIIVEDRISARIITLKSNHDDQLQESSIIKFNEEITNTCVQDHLIWFIHKSQEISVLNVLTGLKVQLIVDNYKIRQLLCKGNDILFVSEIGEILIAPLTKEDLDKEFKEEIKIINITLSKAPNQKYVSTDTNMNVQVWNGLYMINQKESVTLKCPITELYKNTCININAQDLLVWEDAVIFNNQSDMWVVDLRDGQLIFKFPNTGSKYLPVSIYNNFLYYITWNKTEVNIYCSWNASVSPDQGILNQDCPENTSAKLSSQESLKLQLNTLVDSLLLGSKAAQVTTQLKSYFEQIEDYLFLINIATKLCEHDISYKHILYSFQTKLYATGHTDFLILLSDIINKVELMEYICFKGNKNYTNINLYEKNLKELCIAFISKSDLDLASICWLKYSEKKPTFTLDDIMNILYATPFNIKMSALLTWLKNFVPPLLDENPFFIDVFVKWTMERVFMLEQSGYWPKIGLKFIEEIISVLEFSLKMVMVRPISMDDLDTLKDSINYIIELKEKYKINMLLDELSSQNYSEVALIMLRRCYTEDLELFLQEYLPSYATRHLFELDDTLRSYIDSEAAINGGGIDGYRLKILLNAFRSINNKLDCLLHVLKALDVPWNSHVLELAVAAAASATKDFTVTDGDKTLALEIQQELNYAKIKMILKKYNFPLTCTDYMLVLNKLMSAVTVDLQDLKVIMSTMTNLKNYGNVLYIDRCLNDCETTTALKYFKNITNKEQKVLLKTILYKYEQIITGEMNNILIERNYLDFLLGTHLLSKHEERNIENLYHLKNSYSIIMTMNDIYIEDICYEKANISQFDNGGTASSSRGGCISQLTQKHQSNYSLIVDLLRQTSSSYSARKLVENLLLPQKNNNPADDSPLLSFKDGNNSPLLLDCVNTMIQLISRCDEHLLHNLVHHLSLLNSLVNANIIVKNLSVVWKFNYIYLPMSPTREMDALIVFYETLSQDNNPDVAYDISESYDFIPIRKIGYLLKYFMVAGESITEELFQLRDRICRKLISKVILSQELDEILLIALLLLLSKYEATEDRSWLFEVLQGQNETLSTTLVCFLSSPILRRTFGLDNSFLGNTIAYPPQYLLKNRFGINLADIALPDNSEETWDVKVILFCVLKQFPHTNFDRLVEMCRSLNVPINEGLTLQLISLLSSWDLEYKIFNDDLQCREIIFLNDEKDLIAKCSILWENIENRELLRDVLNDFWKNGEVSVHGRTVSINPYYYEVYLCIYHLLFGPLMEIKNAREYLLLNFLKEYRRKSSPKQYEFELFSVKGMFPEVGYYRLPFHLFMRDDMWSNLKSEITLETYEQWLPIVGLLSLDADLQTARDMICSNALKQTMTSRKHLDGEMRSKESEPWRLTTREEPLLRAAHRCVRHIANMEWAGACLFYVLQGCARGADQVAAAQLCYQFAQKWESVQPGNRAVRQMERLHSTLSTRHSLHKIEWACEEFVRLSTEPAQLIRALYLHPSFVDKMSRHDVNRAVNEIADKNGINISSIRIQILENILEQTSDENKSGKQTSGLNTRELMTAKYILKATCPKMGAIYLSRIAFDDESDFNKSKKLRALQCLMSYVETDTAVKVTNRERVALWNSLVEMICVVNIEKVDMPWIVATFVQDKIKAIEQLVQSNTNSNIDALKIAAELTRRYGDDKTIRGLLPLLLRVGLYDEMSPLLLKVSSPPNELTYSAWRAVLVSPFQRADYPITERQKIKCLNAVNLLPICPVIKDDDLVEIWKNCIRCKCYGIGCLVLPYMTSQTRQSLIELKKIDKRNLIASIKNLHTETYLVSGAMYVVENMLFRACR